MHRAKGASSEMPQSRFSQRLCRICTALMLAFGLAACAAPTTAAIANSSGLPTPGSIASLEKVTLGGVEQWILIRGRRDDNPLLLKLHGGPGQAEMATAKLNSLLENDFVVIEWDQRGAGKSAMSLEPKAAMTMGQLVLDTLELSEHLLKRFGRKSLILVGHSWGSAIGLQAIQRRPELYRGFISTGQMANYSEAMVEGYRLMLQSALEGGEASKAAKLQSLGAPPYSGPDGTARRKQYVQFLEGSGNFWRSPKKFDRVGWMIASPEYSWMEKLRFRRAAQASFDQLLPDLIKLDMKSLVPKVDVPVYFIIGRHDFMAPPSISAKYFASLIAPKKEWIWFENSAHFPQWEEAERFHELLSKRIAAELSEQ